MAKTQSQLRITARVDEATQVLLTEQVLKLSERDAALLAEALDAPAKVHPRLQQAAKRYQVLSSQ